MMMSKSAMAMAAAMLLSTATTGVHGQSFPYDCECEKFCNHKCSIDPVKPHNVTVYRMTPFGVYDLSNKNTGDAAGDLSFMLSKRNEAAECRLDPTDPQCAELVNFEGDIANSTDLILEMKVEWDGKFGPYLECNDLNTSEPLGEWACKFGDYFPTPDYPATCSNADFTPYGDRCFNDDPRDPVTKPNKKEVVKDMGECCNLANKSKAAYWQMDTESKECSLWNNYPGGLSSCKNSMLGFKTKPDPDECMCGRIFQTVGKEDRDDEDEGYWYSHPAGGECKNGHYVGDGSGCTYRHIKTTSAINASCMYARIDRVVESVDPGCFVKCDQPQNKTSECYNECYESAQYDIEDKNMTKLWIEAMSLGPKGCPQVHINSALYKPEYPEPHEL